MNRKDIFELLAFCVMVFVATFLSLTLISKTVENQRDIYYLLEETYAVVLDIGDAILDINYYDTADTADTGVSYE